MPKVRCHFISVFKNTFKTIWYLIAMLLFSFFDTIKDIQIQSVSSKFQILGLIGIFSIIMIVFILNLLKWWKTKIYIEEDTFILERNQLSQSKTTVKLSSISTVNLQQNIFEKIFDVYTLQLDINSSVTANKTDFNLVFNNKTAFALRDCILSYLDGNTTDETSQELQVSKHKLKQNDQNVEPIVKFSFKDVIRHCVLSFSFLGGIYAAGVVIVAICAFFSSEQVMHEMIWKTILSLLIAIVPFIYKSISAFFLYHNFALEKKGDKIIVSYGLFTKKQFTLPLNKTNALVIKQPFQARFFNLCYGEIINVGMGDAEENQAPIFCLLVKPDVLQSIIKQIAPQFVLEEKSEKSPKSSVIPILIKWGLWGIAFLIGFAVFYKWWIGLIVLAFFLLCGILSYNTKGLKLYGDKLSITTGVFDKRTITAAYSKLQNAEIKYGPISRRLGLAHGSVSILASLVNQRNSIGYFPIEKFDIISEQIVTHDSIY